MAKKRTKKKAAPKKTVAKKPARKSSRKQLPKVAAIVACDSILSQMPTGKPTLAGVFDNIQVTEPDKRFRPFALMTKLYGGKGTFSVGLLIKTPDGTKLALGSTEKISCEPGDIHQGTMTISGMDVSHSGLAEIFVTIDGKPIGNPCPIKIVHIRKKDEKSSD